MIVGVVVVAFGQPQRVPETAHVNQPHINGEEDRSDQQPDDDERNLSPQPTLVLHSLGVSPVSRPKSVEDDTSERTHDICPKPPVDDFQFLVDVIEVRFDRVGLGSIGHLSGHRVVGRLLILGDGGCRKRGEHDPCDQRRQYRGAGRQSVARWFHDRFELVS